MFSNETLIKFGNSFNIYIDDTVSYFQRFAFHILLWYLGYALCCVVLYCCIVRSRLCNKRLKGSRVLLVTAHPDDECMFFGPTIYSLRRDGVDIYVLCLSEGNHDGCGLQRHQELWDSCKVLRIPPENVTLVRDSRMSDDPEIKWETRHAAETILYYLATYDCDSLITFDKMGVSGHLNHSSLFYAVAYLYTESLLPKKCTVYTLDSINRIRKYWGFLDLPLSCILSSKWCVLSCRQSRVIRKAMRKHRSQMVWFRYLYIYFSRYIVMNTLREVSILDIELDLAVED